MSVYKSSPSSSRFEPVRLTLLALWALGAVLWLGIACAPTGQPRESVRLPDGASTAHAASPQAVAPDAEGTAPPTPLVFVPAAPRPTSTPVPPPPVLAREVPPPRISAAMAVVVDEDSGALLYERAAHREWPPASLTKIVTAMVALDYGNPSARVTVDVDSRVMWDSTVMGLRPGEEVSLEDLLYGLMLPSGNDAAIAIARHIAGSEWLFAELMNAKVRQLGLQHSRFVNPHGLETAGHYSSAYDMAMLAREGMRNPVFRRLAAAKDWDASGLLQAYHLVNLNRLLRQYPGADGVKIGYEDTALNTMVVSATRNGHRVYASLLRSTSRDADGTALLDYAFDAYQWPPTMSAR